MAKTNLYRHYDGNGGLLYVGISLSAVDRLSQHGKSKWFSDISMVKIETFPSRLDALKAEREAIKSESPMHNVQHKAKPIGAKSGRKPRKGYTVSLTDSERARLVRLLDLKGRNGRQQFMAMIDAELAIADPKFLKANKAAEE